MLFVGGLGVSLVVGVGKSLAGCYGGCPWGVIDLLVFDLFT